MGILYGIIFYFIIEFLYDLYIPELHFSEPSTVQTKHPSECPKKQQKRSLEADWQRYHNIHYTSIHWLILKAAAEKLPVLNTSCLYSNAVDPLITKQPLKTKTTPNRWRTSTKQMRSQSSNLTPDPGQGVSDLTSLAHFPAAWPEGKGLWMSPL